MHPSESGESLERDGFTGLYNRRALRQLLAEAYDRARHFCLPLSLLALDLDHFRQINERYLLPGGDRVLLGVARLVASLARPGDVVARDGGDQFSFILPDTDRGEAFRQAERIRQAVAATPMRLVRPSFSEEVSVTVCVGVATASFEEAEAWDLFDRARCAVHCAKVAGRNRVVV